MTKSVEEKLSWIPFASILVNLLKRIKIPGLTGMSVYDILELYIVGIFKGALSSRAGGISFSFLMAICPFLIFILTLIPYVPIPGFQDDFLFLIKQWLPPSTSAAAEEQVFDYITHHNYGGVLSIYFVLSILLMTNGVSAIFGGFGVSYHVKQGRHVATQYLASLAVSILLAIYLITTAIVAFYFEVGIERLSARGYVANNLIWIWLSQKVFLSLMVFISVSTLFFFGPKEGKFSFFSPGSILTTLLFLLFTVLFGLYVTYFSNHEELYGSIGTLLVFMLYIWLSAIILLLGFELNASLNSIRQRIENEKEETATST